MPAIQDLLQELDQEAAATRRTLARIPEDRLTWRPHEKSMTLRELAGHIATLPALVVEMSTWPVFDVKTSNEKIKASRPDAGSVADALDMLDRSVAHAKAALSRMGDAGLSIPWRIVLGNAEVATIPRSALFRSALFNHWYHHRGQLTVYLRLTGVPVPALYGDSADELAFST
ncbi:MAG: DinB family protein [Gemmatimonadota bacterium]|nr:DinB family protein [Gemmatimonadota bacterium]